MGRENASGPEKLEHRMTDMLSYDINIANYCDVGNV
jgi:hypothetical protein